MRFLRSGGRKTEPPSADLGAGKGQLSPSSLSGYEVLEKKGNKTKKKKKKKKPHYRRAAEPVPRRGPCTFLFPPGHVGTGWRGAGDAEAAAGGGGGGKRPENGTDFGESCPALPSAVKRIPARSSGVSNSRLVAASLGPPSPPGEVISVGWRSVVIPRDLQPPPGGWPLYLHTLTLGRWRRWRDESYPLNLFKESVCIMAKARSSDIRNSCAVFFFMLAFWNNTHPSNGTGFSAIYSNSFLNKVPKNLPAETTVLDLSQNNISELQISDFSYILRLRVLNLSLNVIHELDFSVFQYNADLEHLDLSHNVLQTLSCHAVLSLRHLDLTYNNYTDMPICSKTDMPELQCLRLSAKRIRGPDISALTNLQLDTLFLNLEDLSEYRAANTPVFNTKTIQIVSPRRDFHILADVELNATESLELFNIHDEQVNELRMFLLKLSRSGGLRNLTLHNMRCSWEVFISILQAAWESTVEHLVISNAAWMDATDKNNFNYAKTSLKTLEIKETIIVTIKADPKYMYRIFSEMNITALTISGAKLIHMLCPSKPSHFTYLCFSYNILTDTVFENCNNLTFLETLILSGNQFTNLMKMSLTTHHMKSLKYLDMSQNLLQHEVREKGCHWGENLVELNLSSNLLSDSVFRCLPVNIQKLDLQNNQISSIPSMTVELRALEELNLASNRLTDLPGCGQFRSLRLLNAERNSIVTPSSQFYHTCQSIREVKAEHNPFMCSCEIRELIDLRKQGLVVLVGWPESYRCEYPEDLRGIQLQDFHVSELVCNTTLLVVVVLFITVVFAAIISFLCIYLDIPWYLKMMWQWTQVKHRIWRNNPEGVLDNLEFHAFISYSERDSDWVKNVLIPSLEKEDGSIRICQHERNFIAGKSIVENIIDCTEKSYRSIFVLSPNFVQSEWCHYELYFAHHKLFQEKNNSLILLLLEPIPPYIIPAKYYKLKALMAKRTYLEWPKEKGKQGLFWANLRTTIHVRLPEK